MGIKYIFVFVSLYKVKWVWNLKFGRKLGMISSWDSDFFILKSKMYDAEMCMQGMPWIPGHSMLVIESAFCKLENKSFFALLVWIWISTKCIYWDAVYYDIFWTMQLLDKVYMVLCYCSLCFVTKCMACTPGSYIVFFLKHLQTFYLNYQEQKFLISKWLHFCFVLNQSLEMVTKFNVRSYVLEDGSLSVVIFHL